MFSNYFTIAVRHLNRRKGYSFINVMSLSLGIACCLLILLYIRDELSYDRYHDKADRVYRVISEERQGDQVIRAAEVLAPTVKFMRDDYPEVEDMVRFIPPGNAWMIKYGDNGFYERSFYLADTSVFNIFNVPLVAGNPRTALSGTNRVVLSETIAHKYFGDEDPMGKILDAEGTFHFEVSGIMRDRPSNTHLGFDILASFRIQEAYSDRSIDEWDWRRSYSYILLREGSDPAELESKLPGFVEKYLGDRYVPGESSLTISLQPVTDIHLHSHLERELTPNSDIVYIYLFTAIAVFIIIIACINFMNLATARSAGRAREIGLRKVFGADRTQAIGQFLSESLIMSGLAVCFALILAMFSLPWFNMITGKSMSLNSDTVWFVLGSAVVICIVAGCISGSYPALYLSGLAPIQNLKGTPAAGTGNAGMRRMLVVGQFVISIALIICTGVVYNQLDFIRARNMGLNTDQVVAVPLTFVPVIDKSRIYKQRVKESPYVINETAAARLGFDSANEAVGVTIEWLRELRQGYEEQSGELRKIVGVMEDFHFASMHEPIEPLILFPDYEGGYALIKIDAKHMAEGLAVIGNIWNEVNPEFAFEYTFVDDTFPRLYDADQRFGSIFGTFAVLAVVIACLGLFGLASFTAERRTREIGIRKVLGASIPNLFRLLSSEFVWLVIVANVFAWPIAFGAMDSWLGNFSYRVDQSWTTFILAGILAMAIAQLTVGYQAVRAAMANPIESLRSE